jgi:hypothetical protein
VGDNDYNYDIDSIGWQRMGKRVIMIMIWIVLGGRGWVSG